MDKILVVDDKESMRKMLKETLTQEGYEVELASKAMEGIENIRRRSYDLIITDLKLLDQEGIEVLKEAKKLDPLSQVIVMTAYGTVESAVSAMKEGAYDFIQKPFDIDHLLLLVQRALTERKRERENLLLREELKNREGSLEIIGESEVIKEVKKLAEKVAKSDVTVLILGESGTGKELFARYIHQMSLRKDAGFITINCAAIPRELLENELFGSEKGAFTGAVARKIGKFELADKGTIFLDEIGDLDLSLQAKILRVLQEKKFERLGGTQTISVDLRIVAASNRNLSLAVAEHNFREDLYYRLSVFPITIPPLRERKEDIELLANYFIKRACPSANKEFSKEAMGSILAYSWPGNVRELENTMERAAILSSDENVIKLEHLWIGGIPRDLGSDSTSLKDVSGRAAMQAEISAIRKALIEAGGNKTKAAKILGVSYRSLLQKVKEYKIE